MKNIEIVVANASHVEFAEQICAEIEAAALLRGTGIAKRDPLLIRKKIENSQAIIALDGNELVGFCYIQLWSNNEMASSSGLIVVPTYRKLGIAAKVKAAGLELVRSRFPKAKTFGITTNLQVIKINTALGFVPTAFSEITKDEAFWDQCRSCPNYDILQRTGRKLCLCVAMIAQSYESLMDVGNNIINN
jgi:hypothetical protein